MKKHLFTALFLMGLSTIAYSQKEVPQFDTRHKNIYGEFLGSNLLAGVNFDMRLNKGQMDGIGFRAGIGGVSVSVPNSQTMTTTRVGVVTVPLEFNHLVGKRSSSFVSGVGIIPVYASASTTGAEYNLAEGVGIIGGFLNLGYRYQPKRTGVMFQVNWNPMIIRGSGFHAGWIGVGLGIGFK